MKSLFKTVWFWTVFVTVSIMGAIIAWILFPRAFSLTHLDLKMNRQQALEQAIQLNNKYHWLHDDFQQAVSFECDDDAKTYIELEAGGVQAFETMMSSHMYEPYTWQVRHFTACDTHETLLYFTPQGKAYGFKQTLSENDPGELVTQEVAQRKAETFATNDWNIDFNDYELLETHKEITPSKRTDYTFVYERKNQKIGQALYRLELVVSGSQVTKVFHSLKIPETFTLHYQELRSANNKLATAAALAMIILYIFGGCLLGLFFIMRKGWLIILPGLTWALLLAALQFLTQLNELPHLWMEYNTALSPQLFLVQKILGFLFVGMFAIGYFSVIIIAAESLTRKAFPNHLQLWNLWSRGTGATTAVLGRTLTGYIMVPILLAFVASLYTLTTRYFGWWLPSDTLVNPNVLATYAPWLGAFVTSLIAGFTEECLFRAVPLSCGALLGNYFGKRRMGILIAFIIQIIIFGAAHANYPTLPAYARLVELIVPSTIFGLLYLFWGLLPAIICHVTFDVFWFALPLFVSNAPGASINQLLVIVLSAIPLLIVLWRAVQQKQWLLVSDEDYNKSWQPQRKEKSTKPEKVHQKIVSFSTTPFIIAGFVGLLGLGTRLAFLKQNAPRLELNRSQAITKAKEVLKAKNISLSSEWQAVAYLSSSFEENSENSLQHTYIWKLSPSLYNQIQQTYLTVPAWLVRFVRFTGTQSERAQEWRITVSKDGVVNRFAHIQPEDQPGATIPQNEARTIAQMALTEFTQQPLAEFKEISAKPTKHPHRTDWLFTFANQSLPLLDKDQARIDVEISGDTVVDTHGYIQVPEQWQREQTNKETTLALLKLVCTIFMYALLVAGLSWVGVHLGNQKLNILSALKLFGALTTVLLLLTINRLPQIVASFNTCEPWRDQLFTALGFQIIYKIFIAGLLALLITLVLHLYAHFTSKKTFANAARAASIGLLMTVLITFLFFLFPQEKPLLASYAGLAGYFDLNYVAQILLMWVMMTILLSLLARIYDYAGEKKFTKPLRIFGIFTVPILLLFGLINLTNPLTWLAIGALTGTVIGISYDTFFCYDYALIATATASYAAYMLAEQAIFNPFAYAWVSALLGIILLYSLSYYWYKHMNSAR